MLPRPNMHHATVTVQKARLRLHRAHGRAPGGAADGCIHHKISESGRPHLILPTLPCGRIDQAVAEVVALTKHECWLLLGAAVVVAAIVWRLQPEDGVMDRPGATWREWRWAASSVADGKAASGSTRTKARCWCLKQRIHGGESVSPMSDVGQTDVKAEVSHHLSRGAQAQNRGSTRPCSDPGTTRVTSSCGARSW